MLKALAALSVLQLSATAFLIARLDEANARLALAEAAIAVKQPPAAGGIAPAAVSAPAPTALSGPHGASGEILSAEAARAIIREELAAYRFAQGAPRAANAGASTGPVAPDPKKSAAMRRDFDRLLSMRNIGARDLDRYLELAAALPESERKSALSELSRAINDGRIEGRF